jgi:hypothetical protein
MVIYFHSRWNLRAMIVDVMLCRRKKDIELGLEDDDDDYGL